MDHMITEGRFLSRLISSDIESLWRERRIGEKFSVSTDGHSSMIRNPSLLKIKEGITFRLIHNHNKIIAEIYVYELYEKFENYFGLQSDLLQVNLANRFIAYFTFALQ